MEKSRAEQEIGVVGDLRGDAQAGAEGEIEIGAAGGDAVVVFQHPAAKVGKERPGGLVDEVMAEDAAGAVGGDIVIELVGPHACHFQVKRRVIGDVIAKAEGNLRKLLARPPGLDGLAAIEAGDP